jgi:hypothetical protein
MKTLRFFGVALLTVLMSVSFFACSSSDDDDDSNTPSIVGTWIETDNTNSYQGKLVFSGKETSGNVTYLEDNKTIWTGTYKVNGSKLAITWSEYYFECTIKTLTSSTLILERIESDGDIEITTYKRQ